MGPPDEWKREELERLAEVSGKPLEVSCAAIFRNRGWFAQLSTYYVDPTTDKVRELDLLAGHTARHSRSGAWIGLRGLVSAKGFPPDQAPIGYCVPRDDPAVPRPQMIGTYMAPGHVQPSQVSWVLTNRAAHAIINSAVLRDSRPLVGLDIYRRKDALPYERRTDRDLFDGLDSALKATAYWAGIDLRRRTHHATLNLPILVLSRPYWEIDIGASRQIRERDAGYILGLYPMEPVRPEPQSVLALVSTVDRLDDLLKVLNDVQDWWRGAPASELGFEGGA